MTGDFTSKFNRYTEKSGEQKLQPTKRPIRILTIPKNTRQKLPLTFLNFP